MRLCVIVRALMHVRVLVRVRACVRMPVPVRLRVRVHLCMRMCAGALAPVRALVRACVRAHGCLCLVRYPHAEGTWHVRAFVQKPVVRSVGLRFCEVARGALLLHCR